MVAVFEATGSINQAAKANGISHGQARRVLIDSGLVGKNPQPAGKAEPKARFFELLELAGRHRGPPARSGSMNARLGTGATVSARSATRGSALMARSSTTAIPRTTTIR